MAERIPSWAWGVVGVLSLAWIVFGVITLADPFGSDDAEPLPAEWEVRSDAELDARTTTVPILVHENLQCASGRSAEGRIQVTVDYRRDEIEFDVGVRPRGGAQNCPDNPVTPYTVELDEPLGDRSIVGERPIGDGA